MARDDEPIGHGRHGGRLFRSGELHLVLLALLAGRPQHGYELLAELEAHFGPAYRASPGSVYPALSALEAERLVVAEDDGDRRVYRISKSGARALAARRRLLASIEARTGARLGDASLEAALTRFSARVRAVGGRVDAAKAESIFEDAAARIERLAGQEEGA